MTTELCLYNENVLEANGYQPKLRAYEKPELFEPVDLTFEDVSEAKFCLPVCIRAEHRTTGTVYYVRQLEGAVIRMTSKIEEADKAYTMEVANEFLDRCIRWYNDAWSFEIWSVGAFK